MEKISGIYSITNLINGKFYIGSSKDIYDRWNKHKRELNNGTHVNCHLQHAWNKYGKENFMFVIIERCDIESLIAREQYHIDFSKCYDHNIGYNILRKADSSEKTDEVKRKISNSLTGKYCGENNFNNIYSEEKIKNIIDDLLNGTLSNIKIADKNNVPLSVVANIKNGSAWKYMTKNLEFPKGNNYDYIKKLNENSVNQIIEYLLNGMSDGEIAENFNVDRKTISDIRHHKTWKKLTKDYDFPASNGLKIGEDNNKSKLTADQVKEIKEFIKNKVYTFTELSKMYGISISAISNIKYKKAYKYI